MFGLLESRFVKVCPCSVILPCNTCIAKPHQTSEEKKDVLMDFFPVLQARFNPFKLILFLIYHIRNCTFLALSLLVFSRQAVFPRSKNTTGPHGADHSADLLPRNNWVCAFMYLLIFVYLFVYKRTIFKALFWQLHHFCFYCCKKHKQTHKSIFIKIQEAQLIVHTETMQNYCPLVYKMWHVYSSTLKMKKENEKIINN